MLQLPEPHEILSSRTQRLVRQVAAIAAAGCFLGLLATRMGG